MFSRGPVEDLAAADGYHRRVLPDNEPITRQSECRLLKTNLDEPGLAGLQSPLPEQDDISHEFGSSNMEAYSFPNLNRPADRGKQFQMTIEHRGGLELIWNGKHHPSNDIGNLNPLQVQCCPLTRQCFL